MRITKGRVKNDFALVDTIAENIKMARKTAGLTRLELVKRAGVSNSCIPANHWENGVSTPKIETLIKIAKACGVPLSSLLPYDEASFDVMTFSGYQQLAARTINKDLSAECIRNHALFGLSSEVGEVLGIFQKELQGHEVDRTHVAKEIGDCLWFLAELCTILRLDMGKLARLNIEKLKARYPDGFEEERSLHREAGDI